MTRRRFIKATTAIGVGASFGLTSPSGNAQLKRSPDVVVIGAGTFGVWTAYHLQKQGTSVKLLDAYGPGNSRSSSGGETRQMQADPREDVYTRSAIRSYQLWKQLEADSGRSIVLEMGRLGLFPSSQNIKPPSNLAQAFAHYKLEAEILSPEEIRYRWPQVQTEEIDWAVYTQGAAGSLLKARDGIRTVASEFVKSGGDLQIARCLPKLDSADRVVGIQTQNGDVTTAKHYVFACGPWLQSLFPDLLGKRLRVQRRDVLFYGSPPGDDSFAYPNMPSWSVYGSGYYGFPDIDARGFKVAPHPDLNTINPDTDERLILPSQVKKGREFLAKYFPKLAEMPITETRVCQVSDTVDGDFIVDLHPNTDNVWIVGGGSGHGFKHGPAVGEFSALRVLGEVIDESIAGKYQLTTEEFS